MKLSCWKGLYTCSSLNSLALFRIFYREHWYLVLSQRRYPWDQSTQREFMFLCPRQINNYCGGTLYLISLIFNHHDLDFLHCSVQTKWHQNDMSGDMRMISKHFWSQNLSQSCIGSATGKVTPVATLLFLRTVVE